MRRWHRAAVGVGVIGAVAAFSLWSRTATEPPTNVALNPVTSFSDADDSFFAQTFGFEERAPAAYDETQRRLLRMLRVRRDGNGREEAEFVLPQANGADSLHVSAGVFATPSVAELRAEAAALLGGASGGAVPVRVAWSHLANGDAHALHGDPRFSGPSGGATFQAASQFNCLEFPSPRTVPEAGVTSYVWDRTQGPACAVACAAATAYRNYLVPVTDADAVATAAGSSSAWEKVSPVDGLPTRGQRSGRQLNTLRDASAYVASVLGAEEPWLVRNGYSEARTGGRTDELFDRANTEVFGDAARRAEFISKVRVGVTYDADVTGNVLYGSRRDLPAVPPDPQRRRKVTQTWNSAVAVGYSRYPAEKWEPLARAVLEASYEATLLVGLINGARLRQRGAAEPADTAVPSVLLTQVGGGVFGNERAWIVDSMRNAAAKVEAGPFRVPKDGTLRVGVVHFGAVDHGYAAALR